MKTIKDIETLAEEILDECQAGSSISNMIDTLIKFKLSLLDEVEKRLPEEENEYKNKNFPERDIKKSARNDYRQQVIKLINDIRK